MLPPPPPFTHTHTNARAYARTCTLARTHTHTHARTHARTHTRTHSHTHSHTHTHTHTHTRTPALAQCTHNGTDTVITATILLWRKSGLSENPGRMSGVLVLYTLGKGIPEGLRHSTCDTITVNPSTRRAVRKRLVLTRHRSEVRLDENGWVERYVISLYGLYN